jgi:hypothetical protein
MENLNILTQVKRLCEYVYEIIPNTPVKYRWNLIAEIEKNTSSIMHLLHNAWAMPMATREPAQRQIDAELKALGDNVAIGLKLKVFNNHQAKLFAGKILSTRRALYNWINGTKKGDKK